MNIETLEGASPPPQTSPPLTQARTILTQYPVSVLNAFPKYTVFSAAVTAFVARTGYTFASTGKLWAPA